MTSPSTATKIIPPPPSPLCRTVFVKRMFRSHLQKQQRMLEAPYSGSLYTPVGDEIDPGAESNSSFFSPSILMQVNRLKDNAGGCARGRDKRPMKFLMEPDQRTRDPCLEVHPPFAKNNFLLSAVFLQPVHDDLVRASNRFKRMDPPREPSQRSEVRFVFQGSSGLGFGNNWAFRVFAG